MKEQKKFIDTLLKQCLEKVHWFLILVDTLDGTD